MHKNVLLLLLLLSLPIFAQPLSPHNSSFSARHLLDQATFRSLLLSQEPSAEAVSEDEDIRKLKDQTAGIEKCLFNCAEFGRQRKDATKNLQENAEQQKNFQSLILISSNYYRRELGMCRVSIFEDVKSGKIMLETKGSASTNIREAGWLIPADCAERLINIRKDIANTMAGFFDLRVQATALWREWEDADARKAECLKNCEAMKNELLQVSAKIKRSMEDGMASPAAVKALAEYDQVTDKIRRMYQDAGFEDLSANMIRESTASILNEILSYQSPSWGIRIDGNTDWKMLGFLQDDPMSKAAGDYSGGLFIPPDMAKIMEKLDAQQLKPASQRPRQAKEKKRIEIIAPILAVSGKPLTVSITDDAPQPGVTIATDQSDVFMSVEGGMVTIPALRTDLSFISFFAPGTTSVPVYVRVVKSLPNPQTNSKPPYLALLSEIVRPGHMCDLIGTGLDGDAADTEIAIGEKKFIPLAESPASLSCRIPDDLSPGSYTMIIREKERNPAEIPLTCIRMRISVEKPSLKKGESISGKLIVEGTDKPFTAELVNYTPQLVQIDRMVVSVKNGSGDFKIKGLRPGSYSIGIGAIKRAP